MKKPILLFITFMIIIQLIIVLVNNSYTNTNNVELILYKGKKVSKRLVDIDIDQLDLNNHQLSKIQGLDKLTQLKELYLASNQLTKINGLENCNQLKVLYLGNNRITKIEGLDNLAQLEVLNLDFNYIMKIEGLENLNQLKVLYLGKNQISKKEFLKAKKKYPNIGVIKL